MRILSSFLPNMIARGYQQQTVKGLMAAANKSLDARGPQHAGGSGWHAVVNKYKIAPHRFLESRYYAQIEKADYTGAPDDLRRFIYRMLVTSRKQGMPLYPHTVWRSDQLSDLLYRQGEAYPSDAHQRSCAVDFCHLNHHWNIPLEVYTYIGELGRACARSENVKIDWGGDNRYFPDGSHFELSEASEYPLVADHSKPLNQTIGDLVKCL